MKTKIIGLLLILSGCGYAPMDNTQDIIITDIESYADDCIYYARGVIVTRTNTRAYFYDKCGKFTVGDTVKIVKR